MDETKASKRSAFAAGLKRWGAFIGIAAGALLLFLLPFLCQGKYLVWNHAYADGVTQHAAFLEYTFRNGLFGGLFGGYDYNIGLGADYVTSFAYYMLFDPVNLLLYILPRGNFLLSYSVLVCVKLLLCAVCMYVYLRAHAVRQTLSVTFAVAYMLCGYTSYTFARHPDLTAGAMYLPLVTLGLERAIDRNKPFLLIAFVFLTTLGSFYMAYMVTVFAVLYSILYYLYGMRARGEKGSGKKFCAAFFRVAGYYLLGLLCASFVLVPVGYGYLTASRSAGKGLTAYTPLDLAAIGGSFFVPVPSSKYSAVMFNAATLLLFFAAAAQGRSVFRTLSVVFAVCMFVPLAGYLMNLCNYASNRYVYMLSFSVFCLLATRLNEVRAAMPDRKQCNYMVKGLSTALIAMGNLGVWAGVYFLLGRVHAAAVAVLATAAVGVLCVSVWGVRKIAAIDFSAAKRIYLLSYKRVFVTFVSLTLAGAVVFGGIYSVQFDDGSAYAALSSPAETWVAQNERDFVRLDTYASDVADINNRPLNNGYKGTLSYNTMASGTVASFLRENGVFARTHGMYGLSGRTALEALLGVKYFMAGEGEYVPAQFTKSDAAPDLYQTDDYLRFGTVFSSAMSKAQWQSLPVLERQYALLTAAVTEDGAQTDYTPLLTEHGEVGAFALKKGKKKECAAPDATGRELYVRVRLNEKGRKSNARFRVSCGKTYVDTDLAPKGSQMYTGQSEFYYKLDVSGNNLTIEALSGAINVRSVTFYSADETDVLARIRTAKQQPHLQNTQFDKHGFSGEIASDGGILLLQIPYARGFTAEIDGQSAPLLRASGGLTALKVSAGTHSVRLTYRTPGLSLGLIGSLAAAILIICLAAIYGILYFVRRRKFA